MDSFNIIFPTNSCPNLLMAITLAVLWKNTESLLVIIIGFCYFFLSFRGQSKSSTNHLVAVFKTDSVILHNKSFCYRKKRGRKYFKNIRLNWINTEFGRYCFVLRPCTSSSFHFLLDSFIEMWLTYSKLYIFEVYSLIRFETYNQDREQSIT